MNTPMKDMRRHVLTAMPAAIASLALLSYDNLLRNADAEDRGKFFESFELLTRKLNENGKAATDSDTFALVVAAAYFNFIEVQGCNVPGATERYAADQHALICWVCTFLAGTGIHPEFGDGLYMRLRLPDGDSNTCDRMWFIHLP